MESQAHTRVSVESNARCVEPRKCCNGCRISFFLRPPLISRSRGASACCSSPRVCRRRRCCCCVGVAWWRSRGVGRSVSSRAVRPPADESGLFSPLLSRRSSSPRRHARPCGRLGGGDALRCSPDRRRGAARGVCCPPRSSRFEQSRGGGGARRVVVVTSSFFVVVASSSSSSPPPCPSASSSPLVVREHGPLASFGVCAAGGVPAGLCSVCVCPC